MLKGLLTFLTLQPSSRLSSTQPKTEEKNNKKGWQSERLQNIKGDEILPLNNIINMILLFLGPVLLCSTNQNYNITYYYNYFNKYNYYI